MSYFVFAPLTTGCASTALSSSNSSVAGVAFGVTVAPSATYTFPYTLGVVRLKFVYSTPLWFTTTVPANVPSPASVIVLASLLHLMFY